ncbi:MAG: 23S rRNA (adenine(2503)-C(2))-methyltransferase RlmN [Armatimonadetes bacterium]|nr:23S rRNA (adenine(2503)-C(2))-methyltransferase RlmN [Armatimonadota bacterium]
MELIGQTTGELEQIVREMGHPAYRGRQLAEWIYKRAARSTEEMINLPEALRAQIRERFTHPLTNAVEALRSDDGAVKYLVELCDGNRVESVYLPYEDRTSVCISTEVGCAMNCAFCATGIGGLTRNLSAGEMVDQVLLAQADQKQRISHVVYMGMGEPLANYTQTVKSLRLLTGELGISARHLTLSTVGLAPAIRQLADEGLPITLAVSIHAPDDALRAQIMPIARTHSMDELLDACRYWIEKTHRKITFEYLLLENVNDSPEQARDLARRLKSLLANVNIIPYNFVEGRGDFHRPKRQRIDAFKRELEQQQINVTERMRRGNTINAACGQLRHESEKGRKISA